MPIFDTGLDIGLPFLGRATADIKDDRLDRLRELCLGILLLQPPACDVANRFGRVVLVIGKVNEAHAEEPDARIVHARLHWIVRQLHHAVMDHGRDRAAPASTTTAERACAAGIVGTRRGVRRQHARFNIRWEGLDLLDERATTIHVAGIERTLRAELVHLFGEQVRHFDHRFLVGAIRLDGKDLDDGCEVRSFDGLGDRIIRVGANGVTHITQEHFLAAHLPADNTFTGWHACIGRAGRRLRNRCNPQHVLVKGIEWNLVVQIVINLVDVKETSLGDGLVRDHFVVRLDGVFLLVLVVRVVRLPVTPSGPAARPSLSGYDRTEPKGQRERGNQGQPNGRRCGFWQHCASSSLIGPATRLPARALGSKGFGAYTA